MHINDDLASADVLRRAAANSTGGIYSEKNMRFSSPDFFLGVLIRLLQGEEPHRDCSPGAEMFYDIIFLRQRRGEDWIAPQMTWAKILCGAVIALGLTPTRTVRPFGAFSIPHPQDTVN